MATVLVLGGLMLAALPVVGPQATAVSIREAADGTSVASVGLGSIWWIQGIRPGMAAEWQTVSGVERHSFEVLLPGGLTVTIPRQIPAADASGLVLGLLLALMALVVRFLRLPGAAPVAAAAVGIPLLSLSEMVGLPASLPAMLLPPTVALAVTRIPHHRRQRAFDLAGMGVVVLLLGAGLLISGGVAEPSWAAVWLAPLAVGVILGLTGELLTFISRLETLPIGTPRRLLAALVPLAADSRMAGADEERSRLAIQLHNEVLPQLETSMRDLRGALSIEAATGRLQALASDLRGVMQQHQTVTLELGGVAEALRAEVETLATSGPRVEFFVRGGSRRPPARVELAAYRVGQAAIDNAVRHSGADTVAVTISSAEDRFELVISDDGVGIDDVAEDEARRRGRIGLAQMRLRAEAAGATLDIRSASATGTEIRFLWAA